MTWVVEGARVWWLSTENHRRHGVISDLDGTGDTIGVRTETDGVIYIEEQHLSPFVDGVLHGLSDHSYHADRSTLSSSGARLLLPPSCPAKFKAHMDEPPKPKPQFDFGHLVHTSLLGTGSEIVAIDAKDYRSKAAQEQRDAAHAEGKTPALIAEVEQAAKMVTAVYDHPLAHDLFLEGDAEVSLYATHESGVRLRARPDWMTPHDGDGRLVIVDYKTAADANPKTFARKAYDYGYHIQLAWYWTVATLLELDESPAFLFVVQEKTPPYLVSVCELDTESFMLGQQQMNKAIAIFHECSQSGKWPGYGDGLHSISLPGWAFSASGRTIGDLLEGVA
jgi:PDDEXK-like domain of unknown function (DUF3799)